MSWFFGSKAPQPPVIPPDFIPPPGGSSSGGDDPPRKGLGGTGESSYRFDSAALERAAQAARDLEKSSHAKEVRFSLRCCIIIIFTTLTHLSMSQSHTH